MNSASLGNDKRLAALAHELRNPLASIVSGVELLQALEQTSDEIPHLLETVAQKALQMTTVLDDFLEIASETAATPSAKKNIPSGADIVYSVALVAVKTKGLKVLIVDDNTTAADALGQLLMLRGHDVQVAHGGKEGLQKALLFHPQVAILDIGMPDMDGYKLCEILHSHKLECRYIALTGYGHDMDKQRATEAGFDFHLTKPSRVKDIQAILEQVPNSKENA